jgi:hypothetical protein
VDGVRSDSFIEGRASPFLPGEEREEEEAGTVVQVESADRENMLFFLRPFKTYTTPWEGRPHPTMNEWGGAWVAPSQVRVVWPSPGNLHDPQTFLLLACLSFKSLQYTRM